MRRFTCPPDRPEQRLGSAGPRQRRGGHRVPAGRLPAGAVRRISAAQRRAVERPDGRSRSLSRPRSSPPHRDGASLAIPSAARRVGIDSARDRCGPPRSCRSMRSAVLPAVAVHRARATCGAVAHDKLSARGPMSVRKARKHRTIEAMRVNGYAGSTCYMGGLTWHSVGELHEEVARSLQISNGMSMAITSRFCPATKAPARIIPASAVRDPSRSEAWQWRPFEHICAACSTASWCSSKRRHHLPSE